MNKKIKIDKIYFPRDLVYFYQTLLTVYTHKKAAITVIFEEIKG